MHRSNKGIGALSSLCWSTWKRTGRSPDDFYDGKNLYFGLLCWQAVQSCSCCLWGFNFFVFTTVNHISTVLLRKRGRGQIDREFTTLYQLQGLFNTVFCRRKNHKDLWAKSESQSGFKPSIHRRNVTVKNKMWYPYINVLLIYLWANQKKLNKILQTLRFDTALECIT
jgi:hypothetical protein